MKKVWQIIKKPLCGAIMVFCLLCLLGCTGTAEQGGDVSTYCVQGVVLLIIAIAAGAVGELFM